MKILVTGANGQLGSEIKQLVSNEREWQYTFVDVEEMDLATDDAISSFFKGKSFDFVVNCAAYTAVDKAEEDSQIAYRINAEAIKTIAEICLEKHIRLIHISTDYVFDGEGNRPIMHDAMPNPISVYGKSKLAGEHHVLTTLKDAYIIRTAWVYSTFGKNFVKTIARLAREKDSLNVVYDQIGSPTYAGDLAVAIISIIKNVRAGIVDKPGIYHYTNEGVISWYDFATFIVQYYKLPCRVLPVPSSEYNTLAARPTFSVLDKRKIKNTFGITIPHWHTSLTSCLQKLIL